MEPSFVPLSEMRDLLDLVDTPGLMETIRESTAAGDDDDLTWMDDMSSDIGND
uniref:Uncharacterized protein n=1 Tax=Triticum urartu TaxID=4572 RepID=A0A8R7QHL6_TRIUA